MNTAIKVVMELCKSIDDEDCRKKVKFEQHYTIGISSFLLIERVQNDNPCLGGGEWMGGS